MIHSPAGMLEAFAARIPSASRRVSTPSSRACRCQRWTARVKWKWLSMRPGTTVAPATSSISVSGPEYAAIASAVPRATMSPSSIASASTVENSVSTVRIAPFVTIVSTFDCASAAAAASSANVAAAELAIARRTRVRAAVLGGIGLPRGDSARC